MNLFTSCLRATLKTKPAAVVAVGLIAAFGLAAQTFTVLQSFDGSDNGGYPESALVQGPNGQLYGTTPMSSGAGTVFAVATDGALTTKHNFCVGVENCFEGQRPMAGLARAPNGDFYGTTSYGGTNQIGTVFKITPSGTLTTVYNFGMGAGNGNQPEGRLLLGFDGNFYGTASGGGITSPTFGDGYGTIFKITPGGELAAIYKFCPGEKNCPDGKSPTSGLIQGGNGNFYGVTPFGGQSGVGTVFQVTPAGVLTTLHSFCSLPQCADGGNPNGALVQADNGSFYGTTAGGGTLCLSPTGGCGTVYRITSAGKFTTLHSFCQEDGCPDGANPDGELVQGSDGNLYGTAYYGGAPCASANGCGTLYMITPKGEFTTLHTFCAMANCVDGTNPQAGLVQDTNGTFYGTTSAGGIDPSSAGTVFSFSTGLPAFVEADPGFGQAGGVVRILGQNLARTSAVRFNGVSALFTAVSSTEVAAKVPTGATSGRIEVVTPAGTLISNARFRVLP